MIELSLILKLVRKHRHSSTFQLLRRHLVEVAVDRVFQARCSDSEIECFLVVCRISQQTVDQTSHERVSTTYTVNDMSNVVTTRLVQFAVGIENAAPRIVVCIDSARAV